MLNADFLLDPLDERYWLSSDGRDCPAEHFRHVTGTRHPTESDLGRIIRKRPLRPGQGLSIPFCSPIVRAGVEGPRQVLHLRHLTLESRLRDAHIALWGTPGTGKTTQGGIPMLLSDLEDPDRLNIFFGLKRENYAWLSARCKELGIRMHYFDANDPARSLGFNPLAGSREEAFEVIEEFSESCSSPLSNDSSFWKQAGSTILMALWDCGSRSFPAMLQALEGGTPQLLAILKRESKGACAAAASFLQGGSHNSDTVMATVSGWLNAFRTEPVAATLSTHELDELRLFEGRKVLYVHCDEARLTSLRSVYNLLLQWLLRRAIENSDRLLPGTPPHPISAHIEDLPAWGRIQSLPDRMNTLRSRGFSIVASIQSMAALEHAYGCSARLVAASFATRILLPGLDNDDAKMFSAQTGDRIVYAGGERGEYPGVIMPLPLLTAAEIRSPECSHFHSGRPVTILTSGLAFQAYLPPVFRRPDLVPLFARAARAGQLPPLRSTPLSPPAPAKPGALDFTGTYVDPTHLAPDTLKAVIEEGRRGIGWDTTTGSARRWWEAFEAENQDRLGLVHRMVHELTVRKVSITDYFLAYVYGNTDDLQATLHYMDYTRLRKAAEKRKAEAATAKAAEDLKKTLQALELEPKASKPKASKAKKPKSTGAKKQAKTAVRKSGVARARPRKGK